MRRLAAASAIAAALLAAPGPAPAAPPADERGSWSVEDSEEVRSRLEEADRLLSRGLPDRAAPLFQQVLDRFPDHLVRDPEDGNRFDGARALVLRRLRALPPDSRKAYDAHAGPLGEALLDRALRARDPALLRECGERYILAGDAGPRALLALADLRLARGEPGLAASALRTLLRESAGTRWAGPAAAARLARALGAAGDREGILALRRAREGELDANLREGEASATLRSVIDAALAAAGPPPRPGDVSLLGGAPDRRGVGLPPEALDRVRWVHRNHDRFRWTERDRDQRQNEPSVSNALDASQPVAAALSDGVLFVHHHYHVIARDLYTGTERWRFERYHPHVDRGETARTHGSLIFAPAVAGGLVYAPLQVWPLGDTPLIQRFAGQEIIPHIPVRRLFALDAASGRQVWTHADPRPDADPFSGPLRTLNVTSSPLVIGDEVFAAGASYAGGFTAWAFAADRRTGAVRWTARLGYGQQELNLFGRTVKEVPVAALASDGERLFVQTNMGFVSCIDLATGRPVWSRGYAQSPVPLYQNLWTTPERELTWTGSPPVVAGGLVLAAPADGPDLMALDARTGKTAWTHPSSDRPSRGARVWRLLGADDHRAFVAGTVVRGFDLATGLLRWETPFPSERLLERSAGRGVIADGKVFVPTTRAVHAIDAITGKVVRTDAHPRAVAESAVRGGGNLVATDGAAALVRLDEIEGYYRDQDVRARAQALLRDRPGDPDALVEAGRMLLAAERPDDAIPLLERALAAAAGLPAARADARVREVRGLLVAAGEARAREFLAKRRGAEARDALVAASEAAPDPAAAAAVLMRGAEELRRVGHGPLATELLLRVADRLGSALLDPPGDDLARDAGACSAGALACYLLAEAAEEPARSVEWYQRIVEGPAEAVLFGANAREYARKAVDQLKRIHGEAAYATLEERANEALDRARAARDPAALAAVAERWPNSKAARGAGLEAARVRLETGDTAGAAAAARRLLASGSDTQASAEALWILAEAQARGGKPASSRATFQRLIRLHPDETIPGPEGPVRAADAAARRLQDADLSVRAEPPTPLPAPGGWKTLWHREGEGAPEPVIPDGDPVPGGRLLLLTGSRLDAVDPRTGIPAWTAEDAAFRGIAVSAGGFLVFARESDAVGVDPATGEIAWRTELPGTTAAGVAADALAVLLCSGGPGTDESWTFALDPGTGEPAWPKTEWLPGTGTRLWTRSDGVAVLSPPILRTLHAADGSSRVSLNLRSRSLPPGEAIASPDGPLVVRRETGIEAYDPETGEPIWRRDVDRRSRCVAAAAGGGFVVVLDGAGALAGLDAATGRESWRTDAGKGRGFDPSATAIAVDARAVYGVSSELPERGGGRVEARDLRTGSLLWTAPISREPVLVEVRARGGAVLVKYLSAGARAGLSGVVLLDAATGRTLDEFADPRLGGESFDAFVASGVLAITAPRFCAVRGK